jgi:uncharacterized protein (DUF169 family)
MECHPRFRLIKKYPQPGRVLKVTEGIPQLMQGQRVCDTLGLSSLVGISLTFYAHGSAMAQQKDHTMTDPDYAALDTELRSLLGLQGAPIAITFSDQAPPNIEPHDAPIPSPTPDGRTGRVPAGCVFWIHATERTFTTVAADHGNCSVGSVTHGFKTLEEVSSNADVAALLESGWVTMDIMPTLPVVQQRSNFITYGPLSETPSAPDVILLRLNARQAMVLSDALPELRFEGKPQCHIIPMAKEGQDVAVSVGCMLSRVRTGMSNHEMTGAVPGPRLAEVVEKLKRTSAADTRVAAYASEDKQRFDV